MKIDRWLNWAMWACILVNAACAIANLRGQPKSKACTSWFPPGDRTAAELRVEHAMVPVPTGGGEWRYCMEER